MIKRYCDRCGQQIDEGVHAWYVLELHGTDGEFRHKELCEECYAYLCEKDEVPMPQTDDKCIGCKLCYEGICYCPEDCEACDRNEPTPQEYEKWLFKEPKVEDEPQLEVKGSKRLLKGKTEPQTDNGIGCSRCEGRFDCYDRDMPHAVRCNNYGKVTDRKE